MTSLDFGRQHRWWLSLGLLSVAVALAGPVAAAEPSKYLGPIDVVASPDGKTLYVVEADGLQIAVVNVADGKVARTIACPAEPTGRRAERQAIVRL